MSDEKLGRYWNSYMYVGAPASAKTWIHAQFVSPDARLDGTEGDPEHTGRPCRKPLATGIMEKQSCAEALRFAERRTVGGGENWRQARDLLSESMNEDRMNEMLKL